MSWFRRSDRTKADAVFVVANDTRPPKRSLRIVRSRYDLYVNGDLIRTDQELTENDHAIITRRPDAFYVVGWIGAHAERIYLEEYAPMGAPILALEGN